MRKNSSVVLHTSSHSNLNGNINYLQKNGNNRRILMSLHQSETVALILDIVQEIFQKLLLDGGYVQITKSMNKCYTIKTSV